MLYYLCQALSFYTDAGKHIPRLFCSQWRYFGRPTLLNSNEKKLYLMDSWMKDGEKYSENDKKKLEKGSGFVKVWTLVSNWLYRVVSW